MQQHTEGVDQPPTLEGLHARQQELERRVNELEHRLRDVMARLAQDELDQFDRVEE